MEVGYEPSRITAASPFVRCLWVRPDPTRVEGVTWAGVKTLYR
jgi:hypothetical protein